MKAYKVEYKHGHFIDKTTKKRIIFVQGAELIINAEDGAFIRQDEKLNQDKPLASSSKGLWAKSQFGDGNFIKIMRAKEKLFFRIGNSRRIQGDESEQYIFLCSILEDLYIYKSPYKSGSEARHWRLAECRCKLEKCIKGGLELSENLKASSLNQLFSNTVQFYFSMQRSGSCNAFSTFFNYDDKLKIEFDKVKRGDYFGLAKLRFQKVQERNSSIK